MDLDETRAALTQRLERLTRREQRIERHFNDPDREISKDWDDAAIERENDEVVSALDVHTRREMSLLRAALDRIEAGTYGSCLRCDEPIGDARLSAMPEAPYCMGCTEHLS